MSTSFLSKQELSNMGFKAVGENVLISRYSQFYGISEIKIGNNVRVDDFCILSGEINLHDFVHIAAGCYLFAGDAGIEMGDFSGLSSRCSIYACSDDYGGDYLTNPMVPYQYRKIIKGKVQLGKHVIIGTGSIILPGVVINEGAAVGSMTLVNKSLDTYSIYIGIPAKMVKARSRKLIDLEIIFRNSLNKEKNI